MHDCHTKFESVIVLRAKLIERLGEQVPNTVTFDVGYYDGQHHSKIWLCSNKDLEVMYHKYPSSEITLWCDGCTNEDSTGCKKRKRDDSSSGHSKRQKREEVDTVFDQLKEKHGSKYKRPRQQSVTSAISGAAITLAKALGGTPKEDAKDTSSIPTTTPTSSYR